MHCSSRYEKSPFADNAFDCIFSYHVISHTDTEGAEVNVPHFYVNLEDIFRLLPDFTIHNIRYINNCYHDGNIANNCHYYISATLNKEAAEPDFSDVIGKEVSGHIDRPLGTAHPRHPEMLYSVNYGYVDGIFAADGAEQDIYLLNETKPVEKFTGKSNSRLPQI